jgi:conjugal transfer pilus assembly protein TraA
MNATALMGGLTSLKNNAHVANIISVMLLVAGISILMVVSAIAGTDSTFDSTVNQLTNWTEGSLGKLAGVAGVAVALVGMVMKFDWRLIGGAAGIGLTAATGPGIVSALTSAIF